MIQVIGRQKDAMQIDLQSTETYTEKRPSVVSKQTSRVSLTPSCFMLHVPTGTCRFLIIYVARLLEEPPRDLLVSLSKHSDSNRFKFSFGIFKGHPLRSLPLFPTKGEKSTHSGEVKHR